MKKLKFVLFLTAVILTTTAVKPVLDKTGDSSLTMTSLILSARADDPETPPPPPTVWVDRAERYDCIRYTTLGSTDGCTNCAWDCEPNEYVVGTEPDSNCDDDKTCCDVILWWEGFFGPCS